MDGIIKVFFWVFRRHLAGNAINEIILLIKRFDSYNYDRKQ